VRQITESDQIHDPAVAAWTGIYFATFNIDGLTVPVIGASLNAPVGPLLLGGRLYSGAARPVSMGQCRGAWHAGRGMRLESASAATAALLFRPRAPLAEICSRQEGVSAAAAGHRWTLAPRRLESL
jgi:hypothetical protein